MTPILGQTNRKKNEESWWGARKTGKPHVRGDHSPSGVGDFSTEKEPTGCREETTAGRGWTKKRS